MKKRNRLTARLLLGLSLLGSNARGDDLLAAPAQSGAACPTCGKTCWCPNTFVPKPLPEPPCIPACAGPDVFQPKPLPEISWCAAPSGPDCFNPKPLVDVPKLCEPWHVCGAAQPSGDQPSGDQQQPSPPKRQARRAWRWW